MREDWEETERLSCENKENAATQGHLHKVRHNTRTCSLPPL